MGRADLGVLAVGGAEEIRLLSLVVVGDTVIQLLAAVGAVQQTRKGADDTAFCGPAAVLAKFLHQGEGLPVDDGRMRILEYLPFLRWALDFLLVLERLGGAAEIHCVTAVFLLAENVRHGGRAPVVRHGGRLAAIPANIAPMLRRRLYLASFQPFGDLRRAEAVYAPSENLPHGLGRIFIHHPAVLTLRVFQIPKGRVGGQRCAGHSLALEHIAYLLAGVLGVPLVEQVLHRDKIADALGGVDVVHNSDVADAEAVEALFQELSHNEPVTPQAGVILDDQSADEALFRQLHNLRERRSCEVRTRPAIVNEHTGVPEAIFLCVLFEDGSLILDGPRQAILFIVTGQAAVQGCDFIRLFCHSSPFHSRI